MITLRDVPESAKSAGQRLVFSAILARILFLLAAEPLMQLFIAFRVQYDENTAGGSFERTPAVESMVR
jgi:hypothetical protein